MPKMRGNRRMENRLWVRMLNQNNDDDNNEYDDDEEERSPVVEVEDQDEVKTKLKRKTKLIRNMVVMGAKPCQHQEKTNLTRKRRW